MKMKSTSLRYEEDAKRHVKSVLEQIQGEAWDVDHCLATQEDHHAISSSEATAAALDLTIAARRASFASLLAGMS